MILILILILTPTLMIIPLQYANFQLGFTSTPLAGIGVQWGLHWGWDFQGCAPTQTFSRICLDLLLELLGLSDAIAIAIAVADAKN